MWETGLFCGENVGQLCNMSEKGWDLIFYSFVAFTATFLAFYTALRFKMCVNMNIFAYNVWLRGHISALFPVNLVDEVVEWHWHVVRSAHSWASERASRRSASTATCFISRAEECVFVPAPMTEGARACKPPFARVWNNTDKPVSWALRPHVPYREVEGMVLGAVFWFHVLRGRSRAGCL